MDLGVTQRRHNPVDSICRKLQTIQRRDRETNSPFQIPKFQSSSYDSPHSGLRCNLEAILKKRTLHEDPESDSAQDSTIAGMVTPTASPGPRPTTHTATPAIIPFTPANATFTITSTLGSTGERRSTGVGQSRIWQRPCSTPSAQTGDNYFSFTRFPTHSQPEGSGQDSQQQRIPSHSLLSYNLNFCSANSSSTLLDSELAYPALVVKRLSMGDGGLCSSEPKKESLAEVSLICEEDLLDTIFHACDTQRRGKVYVSRIVDYLRHTTSRSSEDSGLEELCNMLDPEHKDISIDLDTYHAIMKEWIEDCRNQEEDTQELTQEAVKLRESLSAKRSALLNMTSGSLEAFGGEVSRADLETSDLVYCVADLQFNNQKLQEEVRKLKQAMESMEDTNQKLIEENEELKTQAKVGQQLVQREKLLKEEVEEMKLTLNIMEESRAQASTQSKQLERENQKLVTKIASLQEENLKMTMEVDDLQKKMMELCDLNADLQVQIHSFDSVIGEKEAMIQEKSRQIEELKAAVMEYSSVTERLRADKTRLESQMQQLLPDMTVLNQTSSGSLLTELAMAQNSLEGAERVSSSPLCFTSPLDETLDREVLLLLQGPTPEQMAQEFRARLNRLRKEFKENSHTVLSVLRDFKSSQEPSTEHVLQGLQAQLEQQRGDWFHSLDQLEHYTDSLEKELLKMTSNMRRSRTEILHLSVRVQEQENQKQQLCEELDQLKTPQDSQEASCQTPDNLQQVVEDLDAPSLEWDEEYALPESPPDKEPAEEVLREFCCEGVERCGHQEDEERVLCFIHKGGAEKQASNREETQDTSVEEEKIKEDSTHSQAAPPDHLTVRDTSETAIFTKKGQQENSGVALEEARLPECTRVEAAHNHAVHSATNEPAPLPHSHTLCVDELTQTPVQALPELLSLTQGSPAASTQPGFLSNPEMPSPSNNPPVLDTSISQTERAVQAEAAEREPQREQETTDGMSHSQRQSQEEHSESSATLDRSYLLPVAEEEEAMPEAAQVDLTGHDQQSAERMDSKPKSVDSPSSPTNQTKGSHADSDPSLTEGGLPSTPLLGGQTPPGPKKESLILRNKFKRDLDRSRSMEAIEEQKTQEDSEVFAGTEKEGDTSVISEDASDSVKDDRNSLSPSDKEIEAEFQRLSLGFKCDMFTLEKRLRLEERSRDLAEENVRREVSSCQGLLQALIPRCEDDNQSMEIILRLQKNLDILIQAMTRVSSRSEMLGAIHQESRIGKAVEVMIQHVENLRRMYTKEHAELMELKETLMQNERSFGTHTERDDFRNKKQPGSFYKPSGRRVSIAAIPRSSGGPMNFELGKDATETDADRLARRSPWSVAMKSSQRPPLKRFVSSGAWADTDEPSFLNRYGHDTDSYTEEERREQPPKERKSSLTELSNKITALIRQKIPSPTSTSPSTSQMEPAVTCSMEVRPSVPSSARGLWLWVALVLVLAGLLALLASLVLQPAVDAAPVGTGDSWTTIQQLLWPYTGLRHNGQPPV